MTVVVGYVPDATGYLAVTEAVAQAQWRGTDLVIVNAVDAVGFQRPTASDELDLDAVAARLTADGVPHEVRRVDVGTGDASQAILQTAEDTDADLIVVGLHRRSPVGKVLLGSNAQRVLLTSTRPVLAVRAKEPD